MRFRTAMSAGIWVAFLLVVAWGVNTSVWAEEETTSEGFQDFELTVEIESGGTLTASSSTESASEEEKTAEDPCEGKDCAAGECEVPATTSTSTAVATEKKQSGGLLDVFFGSSQKTKAEAPAAEAREDFTATHKQVGTIKVKQVDQGDIKAKAQAAWGVKSFCLDSQDNLLVAVGHSKGGQLQQLNSEGELLNSWALPVTPEALNVDAEGNFLVGGKGEIFRLNQSGEVLLRAASPVVDEIESNRDAIRKQIVDQRNATAKMLSSQRGRYEKMIERIKTNTSKKLGKGDREEYMLLKKRIADYEKSNKDSLSVEDQNTWALRKILLRTLQAKVDAKLNKRDKMMLKIYQDQIARADEYATGDMSEQEIEQSVTATIAYKARVASISSAGSEVFLATGAVQGYGFDVWRFDENFENPEKVVTQLRGCCGQMDVQCCEAGVFVAENSRHQMVHYDRTGKKINSWGEGAREGVRGFGSCCNPMNVAFGPDGSVYTAESETGRIKRFSPQGELQDLIGSVKLVPGCKKVSIAVTKDGSRIYMLDITRNHIIVMEAKAAQDQIASQESNPTVSWSAYPPFSILSDTSNAGN